LWESWTDKVSGESLNTTTLITTAANDFMQPLHHRMPVILQSETADEWMSGANGFLQNVAERTPAMQAWPVDRRVNNARNQGEDLIVADGDVMR
jgi:putative SOS response-associated peptidase YedK